MALPVQTNINGLGARRFRVGGSKWTTFEYDDPNTGNTTTLALANQIAHTSPEAVSPSVAIQPLDARRPLEVITANAIGMGTLVLEIIELWGAPVWEALGITYAQLGGGANSTASSGSNHGTDLADLFNYFAGSATPIYLKKYVNPPKGARMGGVAIPAYTTTFYNCVISDFQDDETIAIGTMQIYKQITVNYTEYKTVYPGLN